MHVTNELHPHSRTKTHRGEGTAVLVTHSLLNDGMFMLHVPLLHGRVDDQLIQLHGGADNRVRLRAPQRKKVNKKCTRTHAHTLTQGQVS